MYKFSMCMYKFSMSDSTLKHLALIIIMIKRYCDKEINFFCKTSANLPHVPPVSQCILPLVGSTVLKHRNILLEIKATVFVSLNIGTIDTEIKSTI